MLPCPDHLLTLAEWDALPEDNYRVYELAEGNFLAKPRPHSGHQSALARLGCQLHEQLPDDLEILPSVEIVVFEQPLPTVRVPDLIVLPTTVFRETDVHCPAADVLLAIEITIPGTVRTDHKIKLAEYAEAGIPHYWIADLTKPVTLIAHHLVDGEYQVAATSTGPLTLAAPFPLTIDVAKLLD